MKYHYILSLRSNKISNFNIKIKNLNIKKKKKYEHRKYKKYFKKTKKKNILVCFYFLPGDCKVPFVPNPITLCRGEFELIFNFKFGVGAPEEDPKSKFK
jgi:hypothetical protein